MKALFLFSTLSILCSSVLAQNNYLNTTSSEANEIKKRILLVVLPEEDNYTISRYEEDSNFVKLYRNDLDGQRQALQNIASTYWNFSDSIKFVSQKEAKNLHKKYPAQYAVLKMIQAQSEAFVYTRAVPPPIAWQKVSGLLMYSYVSRYNIRLIGITSLTIEIPKKVIEVFLPKYSPSEGDFIYGITQLNYMLSTLSASEDLSANKLYRDLKNKFSKLKNKLLLVDAKELKCDQEEILKAYPYPFKIVDYPTIENALKDKDSNCVVIQFSRYDPNLSTCYISNTGTGEIYSNYSCPTYNYGGVTGATIRVNYPALTIKHFEQFDQK